MPPTPVIAIYSIVAKKNKRQSYRKSLSISVITKGIYVATIDYLAISKSSMSRIADIVMVATEGANKV